MSMRNRQGPFPVFVNDYLGAAFAVFRENLEEANGWSA